MKTLYALMFTVYLVMSLSCGAKKEETNKDTQSTTAKDSRLSFSKIYSGNLDGRLTISMKLSADDGRLEGKYYYSNVGIDIPLQGTIDTTGKLRMEESDKSGKITGSFSGVRQPNGVITGSWASPDGRTSMDFSLFESDKPYEYDPGLLEIERTHRLTPYFIEESHSPSYGYIVKLPAVWKTGEDNSYLGAPTFRSVRPRENTSDPSKEQIMVFSEHEFGDVKEPKEAMNHSLDRLGYFYDAEVDNFQVMKSGEIRSSTLYTLYTATIGTMKTKNIMYVTAGEFFMKPIEDQPVRRAYHVYVVVCQAEEASFAEYEPLFNAIGQSITFGAAPK